MMCVCVSVFCIRWMIPCCISCLYRNWLERSKKKSAITNDEWVKRWKKTEIASKTTRSSHSIEKQSDIREKRNTDTTFEMARNKRMTYVSWLHPVRLMNSSCTASHRLFERTQNIELMFCCCFCCYCCCCCCNHSIVYYSFYVNSWLALHTETWNPNKTIDGKHSIKPPCFFLFTRCDFFAEQEYSFFWATTHLQLRGRTQPLQMRSVVSFAADFSICCSTLSFSISNAIHR